MRAFLLLSASLLYSYAPAPHASRAARELVWDRSRAGPGDHHFLIPGEDESIEKLYVPDRRWGAPDGKGHTLTLNGEISSTPEQIGLERLRGR